MNFVDIHSHLADPRFDSEQDSCRSELVQEALQAGITFLVQGGLGPEDWLRQEALAKKFPTIIPVFGLHPYWVKEHSDDECEQALNQLAKAQLRIPAVGEMGLDLRKEYKDCESRQIEVFERQLELASFANKPVVLHIVRAHEESLRILQFWGLPKAGGFVHSFNGSIKKANDFILLGLKISVGGSLCHEHSKVLQEAVAHISLENLLLESDSPDQAPASLTGRLNRPICILEVAAKIAELKGLKPREVLDRTSQNARKLLAL